MPSYAEYEEAIKNLDQHNWKVDYVFTHTISTTQQIRQSNGCHIFLPPNSPLLPNNLEYHGCRIEINYPVISYYNKQVESVINEQINQLFGVDQDDLRSFYGEGCRVTAGFDCELIADILIISITGESYIC